MKYFTRIFILPFFIVLFVFSKKDAANSYEVVAETLSQSDVQEGAFTVLRNKCNVCHATKKRTDIFTLENMDSLAPEIQKQVFIKKKMPKGRKVKLTEKESETLTKWLNLVLGSDGSS